MAGKAGRSGRPPGALSWYRNPTARCGHALNAAVELWLALVPERRFTMPPKIRRFTAQNVIRQTLCNEIENSEMAVVDVDDVLAWSRRHNTAAKVEGGPTLRRVRGSPKSIKDAAYEEYVKNLVGAWREPALRSDALRNL